MAKENKQTADQGISPGLTLLLAMACGIIAMIPHAIARRRVKPGEIP